MAAAVEIEIESIAAGGDGVGRTEGLVCFVPRTAPGDRATVELRPKGRLARGRLIAVVRPSAARTEPPCAHYTHDRCGGCQLQHLRYEAQLDAKRSIIQDAMTRIGRRALDVPAVEPSPRPWRYRRKLTLAMRRVGGRWIAGLHPYDDPVAVFDLRDCPITDERVVAIWREVLAAARHFPPASALRGALQLLEARASFVLQGGESWPGRDAFFEAVPSLTALWWEREGSTRRLVASRESVPEPGASFAQVNLAVAERLRAHVIDRVRAHQPTTIIDAYAGIGETAVALAGAGARVTAIELDRDASRWCGTLLPEGSRALPGRVEDLLPDALPADVVVLNPPRTGVHERVTGALEGGARPPRAVIYISCNPATLARDVARMPSFRVADLRPFDMFPQTAHVETVCELVPAQP
jgi:23S rRNA (uracil1939-C5)-methyltransferase